MGDQIDVMVITITSMTCPDTLRPLEVAFLSVMTIASNYESRGEELFMRNQMIRRLQHLLMSHPCRSKFLPGNWTILLIKVLGLCDMEDEDT